jgi:hypothetical protein
MWNRLVIKFINFQLRVLTTKSYRQRLDLVIKLGMLKYREIKVEQQVLAQKLADEPGMRPDGTIVTPESEKEI